MDVGEDQREAQEHVFEDRPSAAPRRARFPRRSAPPPPRPSEEPRRISIPFLDCGPEIVVALSTGSMAFQDLVLAFFFGREPQDGERPPRTRSR